MNNNVRVRMAPSPTGFFHVGSARTALYNWLFARHHNGKFILRVEDTDTDRSSRDMIQVILDGMTWLGLTWDEEPRYQSERLALYRQCTDRLIETEQAYYCYCQPEDLETEKKKAYAQKKDWQYDRRCLNLSAAQREKKERAGIPKAVRFMVPEQTVAFHDIVFGDISKESRDIEDFVIMRANGMPTYNLACVVDDHDMEITHVIRGADHIANTPKQVLLYHALGFSLPAFAHLPLILGPDRSKLSKRHGAASVMDYKERGYLPEAFLNYLALIGWSPGDDSEIMTGEELVKRFCLDRINASNAIFDSTKLAWMNQQYIMKLPLDALKEKLIPFIIDAGLMAHRDIADHNDWLTRVCALLQPRLTLLGDVATAGKYFFSDDFEYDPNALARFTAPETLKIIETLLPLLQTIEPFCAGRLESDLRTFGDDHGWKVKQWIHPLRAFTTGSTAGPPLFDTMEMIGRERVVARIKHVLSMQGGAGA